MQILILGGYGVFGGRLAHLLSDCADLTLLIAGRSEAKARAYCDSFEGAAKALPLALDRADIAKALTEHQPDLVVDASGPFQAYGDAPYRVVEACIEQGIDYLDLADGADFVFGIERFDGAARAKGCFVLSGVSSFPVLTAAVLRELEQGMEVQEVEGGIAPSPYAGVGLNVMRAVIGYAGAPVELTRDGRRANGIGLGESRRYTVAVPGEVPLRSIRYSLVDVPDLRVLPRARAAIRSIWMGAGPVPEVLHRMLNVLAKARHALRLPSMELLAPLFYRVLNLMRFGEHRGGAYVHAKGVADGQLVERSWHLLAEGDDGPLIPSMAVEGIVRKLLTGERPEPGARAAIGALSLADYEALFAGRAITTGFREHAADQPLYRQVLGTTFDTLPPRVRALHDETAKRQWQGHAEVRRGKGLLARIAAAVFRFPREAPSIPVTVTLEPDGNGELWTRDFGGSVFASHQSAGRGRNEHLLVERFGLVAIALALVVEGERLRLIPRRWFAFGIPLPHSLMPFDTSFETEVDCTFIFDVEIGAPLVGRVVAYRGQLERVD